MMIHSFVLYFKSKAWKMFVLGAPPVHTLPPATQGSWNLKLRSTADKVVWGISKPVFVFYCPLSQVTACVLSCSTSRQMLLPTKRWPGWWCSSCSSRKMPLGNTSPILPSQSCPWVLGVTCCCFNVCSVLPPVSVLLTGSQVKGTSALRLKLLLPRPLEGVE